MKQEEKQTVALKKKRRKMQTKRIKNASQTKKEKSIMKQDL